MAYQPSGLTGAAERAGSKVTQLALLRVIGPSGSVAAGGPADAGRTLANGDPEDDGERKDRGASHAGWGSSVISGWSGRA